VDVQEIFEVSNLNWIIERYFSPDEKEYLRSMETFSIGSFFELWTTKEAFLKAVGSGFQGHPQQISLVPTQIDLNRYIISSPRIKDRAWVIKPLDVGGGSKAAAAVNGDLLDTVMIPLELE
jgi:phosphopantetheinyl transferase